MRSPPKSLTLKPKASFSARRKLMLGLPTGIALSSNGFLMSCGGGGSTENTSQLLGKIALPVSIKASDLTVVGSMSETQPEADGAFALDLSKEKLSMVSAVHSSGRLLFLGIALPGATEQQLNARSSAIALLFIALSTAQNSEADRRAIYNLIQADAQTTSLAAVIQARLNIDPFALDTPDTQIADAVKQSVLALKAQTSASFGERVGSLRLAAVTDIQPLLKIEPSTQSGVTVNQDGDTPGFSIVNDKRRKGIAHLYKVGYKMPDAAKVDLPVAEAVGERIDIRSTETLSVFNTLSVIVGGQVPWASVTSSRYALTMHPNAEQTFYELVYLTPVYDRAEPGFFIEPRFGNQFGQWRTELEGMYERIVYDFVFGMILEALGLGGVAVSEIKFAEALALVKAAIVADANGVFTVAAAALKSEGLLVGIRGWTLGLAGNPGRISILSEAMLPCVAPLAQVVNPEIASRLAARNLTTARLTMYRGAIRVFAAVYVVAGVFDACAYYKDLHEGEKGNLFSETLAGAKVLISPSTGKVSKGKTQKMTARVTGAQGAKLTYRWTLSGNSLATLGDGAGKNGLVIETDLSVVNLATTPSTVGTLSVEVEVFQVKTTGNSLIGKATANLEMTDQQVDLLPVEARLELKTGSQVFTMTITQPPAQALFYEWKCPSQFGTLTSDTQTTSGNLQTITTASPKATYKVKDGLAGGESESVECFAYFKIIDIATGLETRVDVGNAKSDVSIKQRFTIEMLGVPPEVPSDSSIGLVGHIKEALPLGSKVSWTWSNSGVGSLAPGGGPTEVDQPHSSRSFKSGTVEGFAAFSVGATVKLTTGEEYPLLPVTGSTNVKKGLRQMVFEASGGVFACTDPKACGVSEYTAFIVPVIPKATLYSAVLSGFAFATCNRSTSWTGVEADGGGCVFPITYHPHSSAGPTNAWAVWIGFGGAISGKCVVTITIAP
jgi:hypothetical protein